MDDSANCFRSSSHENIKYLDSKVVHGLMLTVKRNYNWLKLVVNSEEKVQVQDIYLSQRDNRFCHSSTKNIIKNNKSETHEVNTRI